MPDLNILFSEKEIAAEKKLQIRRQKKIVKYR